MLPAARRAAGRVEGSREIFPGVRPIGRQRSDPAPDARGGGRRRIPRNVWAVSAASFLTDVSTEMVVNLLPLFLSQVLGVRTWVIGLIEGVAESTASVVKVLSGALSDRVRSRKGLAVAGYALSTLAKPGLALASSWGGVAAARWGERVGKGVRTAPRDALVADSIDPRDRGLAFGLHRAADTGGAVVGLLLALGVLALVSQGAVDLTASAFRLLVWLSLIPAAGAVVVLALWVRETPAPRPGSHAPIAGLGGLGRPFAAFLAVSALFELGNSSDAFLVVRARERGLGVGEILWVLVGFNAVYALVAAPAGRFSDHWGRRRMLALGWALYAAIYVGFSRAGSGAQMAALFAGYGVYHGLTAGAARAFIADLVPEHRRATAFGAYHAVLGVLDLPASLLAGVLWQGVGGWAGFGPAAPFAFGATTALLATLLLLWRVPGSPRSA